MQVRNQLSQLLEQEKKFQRIAVMNPKFFPTPEGKAMLDEWINDVDIFSQRYLKEHPIYNRIKTIIFHRGKDAISELRACLSSIYKDTEFWKDSQNQEQDIEMKDYEQLLYEILGKINVNDPVVLQYSTLPSQRVLFEKLQSEGLIRDFHSVGRLYCGFTVTYDGVHYFDEHNRKERRSTQSSNKYLKYDVFLSHANKDKLDYVEDLKVSLDKLGVYVFYDKDSIKWGNRWKEKILDGVEKSEFAIIVISENFFGREWTEKELDELLKRQNSSGQEIILPILHNITLAQLEAKYPDVAEIQAISSDEHSKDEIALLFAERLISRLKNN